MFLRVTERPGTGGANLKCEWARGRGAGAFFEGGNRLIWGERGR